jgi:hypothetical protein
MLNNISWASYVFAISITVIIYYIFVLILYYRQDLQNIIFRKADYRGKSTRSNSYSSNEYQGIDSNELTTANADQNNLMPELLLILQNLIKTGANRNFPKEEILLSLQLKLQQFPALKESVHKEQINQFILTAFESICSIHLSGEEISALWIK